MTSFELRQRFLDFFRQRGHKIVPSSSLIPADPSVLFTTAGMQQFKPYYLGETSPFGQNVVSCQKCFRTSDIDEVGDDSHLTFLEMLGNFSFGGYFKFKEEAIKLAYDFIFGELKLPVEKAIFTVFEGNKDVPPDEESIAVWKKLGIADKQIKKFGREDNFWGPTGEEGPCGPTTEIHFNGTEIWNIVFNEYYQDREGKLAKLKQSGVDTGMGLERLAMAEQGKSNVFETDLFLPIIQEIKENTDQRSQRIIADHIKGAVFLISEGILPSNVERGYILRRVLRRAIRYGKLSAMPRDFLIPLAKKAIEIYQNIYSEIKSKEQDILTVIRSEEEKFAKTLDQGLKEFNNFVLRKEPKSGRVGVAWDQRILYGKEAFYLYQSFGFPKEMMQELCKENNVEFDEEGFESELKKHQEVSRAGAEKKFGGVGKEAGYTSARLHTATHLLHAALRQVLGKHVQQMGSDVTSERLRFDFSHPAKLSEEELRKTEEIVNQKIKEDLEVKKEEMTYKEALESGALAFFKEKYPEKVTVYSVSGFSKEICAGPHAQRTSELGHFKIVKEESSGAGIRRIRAILEEMI